MEKYYDDQGLVAVLYSPGYGAGWSTWNCENMRDSLCMDRRIVEAVIAGDRAKAAEVAKSLWPGEYVCVNGVENLRIEWLFSGTLFAVAERDGYEKVIFPDTASWMTA